MKDYFITAFNKNENKKSNSSKFRSNSEDLHGNKQEYRSFSNKNKNTQEKSGTVNLNIWSERKTVQDYNNSLFLRIVVGLLVPVLKI